MGMTYEDAWQEEAYDQMVNQILEENRDEIVDEYLTEKAASYYLNNPDMDHRALEALERARCLLEKDEPEASLVFSWSATELALRDVLMRPIVSGMLPDDTVGPLVAELVLRNRGFEKVLLEILKEYGIDLKKVPDEADTKSIWQHIQAVRDARNGLLHQGKPIQDHLPAISIRLAEIVLKKLHPALRSTIVGSEV